MKKLISIIIVSIIFANVLMLGGCKKNIDKYLYAGVDNKMSISSLTVHVPSDNREAVYTFYTNRHESGIWVLHYDSSDKLLYSYSVESSLFNNNTFIEGLLNNVKEEVGLPKDNENIATVIYRDFSSDNDVSITRYFSLNQKYVDVLEDVKKTCVLKEGISLSESYCNLRWSIFSTEQNHGLYEWGIKTDEDGTAKGYLTYTSLLKKNEEIKKTVPITDALLVDIVDKYFDLVLSGKETSIKDANTVTYSSCFSGELKYDYNYNYYYNNDNEHYGYVCGDYLRIDPVTSEAVTTDALNVRDYPNESGNKITTIKKGETVYDCCSYGCDTKGRLWYRVRYEDNKNTKPKPYTVYKSNLKEGSVPNDLASFNEVAVDKDFVNDNLYYEVSDKENHSEEYYAVGKNGYLYEGSWSVATIYKLNGRVDTTKFYFGANKSSFEYSKDVQAYECRDTKLFTEFEAYLDKLLTSLPNGDLD